MRAALLVALFAALCNAQILKNKKEEAEAEETKGETIDAENEEVAGDGETGQTPELVKADKPSYNYKTNGEDWGEYEPFCDIGVEQSPIDLN